MIHVNFSFLCQGSYVYEMYYYVIFDNHMRGILWDSPEVGTSVDIVSYHFTRNELLVNLIDATISINEKDSFAVLSLEFGEGSRQKIHDVDAPFRSYHRGEISVEFNE